MKTTNWDTVGDIASVAQLTGLNIPGLIATIILIASKAVIFKKRCRNFAEYVKLIGNVLKEITMKDLMKSPGTTEILKQLGDVLRVSRDFLQSCQKKRNLPKIFFSNQLDKAEAEIDKYVQLIPLVNCSYILQMMEAANERSDKLGHAKLYEELHFNSDLYLKSSQDPHIHFRYIQVLVKIGRIDEVERVTREGHIYDAEKTKNFLMEKGLSDIRPLINVCERFRFVPDLIRYLYSKNKLQYIEHCVQVDGWEGVRDYYHKRGRLNELNSIMQGGLEQVRDYYQKRGRLNELISIMQSGLGQRA